MNNLIAVKDGSVGFEHIVGDDSPAVVSWRPEFGSGWVETQSGLKYSWSDGVPERAVDSDARRTKLAAKRAFDLVVGTLAILGLLPLLVLVAVGIKLTSKGPVFFRQAREGINGSTFNALKFRSMRIDDCDNSGIAQTTKDDPRVTAIGRFLRRTSIDELPQLINVLRGEMSIVGPRPHVSGMRAGGMAYRDLVPYYDRRLDMLPGITGWAQANGLRGSTHDATVARRRIDHDIAYIQNFSLLLDLKIIWLTLRNEFLSGSGH
ncbi:sugar transferase [Devosia sediminis]|uniref:Sugar transferase n=1 Tax=Devosia sediminis TaxID=2798801 RepID=A0A934IUR7_9HYPH|nr:sugar transferase [Devosia sediminis]MBJ3783118.1 sugar transferase [Devosia sediminis]